jgi:hypothetical protein
MLYGMPNFLRKIGGNFRLWLGGEFLKHIMEDLGAKDADDKMIDKVFDDLDQDDSNDIDQEELKVLLKKFRVDGCEWM